MVSGWTVATIGDFLDFKNGLNKGKSYFGHGTPIINYSDVYNNRGLKRSDIKGTVELRTDEIKRYSVQKGDVFFTRTSEIPEEVGISSVLLEDIQDCAFSGFILRGRPKNDMFLPEYCQYCFSSRKIRDEIVSNCTYTTRALTNGTLLSRIEILVPPKNEQVLIAKAISDIDVTIKKIRKTVSKKEDLRQACISHLIPRRGQTIPEIRINGFAEEWSLRKAGDLFVPFVDKGFPELPVLMATQDRGMILRDHSHIQIQHDVRNEVTYKRVLPGQFVIHLRSFQGGFAHSKWEGITSPAYTVFGFRNAEDNYDYYWKYLFSSESFVNQLATITYGIRDGRSINFEEFQKMNFYVPSYDEQYEIGSFLLDMDKELEIERKRLAKYEMIKQGMMEELLTGKVRLS